MKVSLKKLALIFSLSPIVGYSIVLACASGWLEYKDESNFTPEIFVDKSYSPLFFEPNQMFYGYDYDVDNNARFNDVIVDDWSEFLENSIPAEQLKFLLLNDSAESDIQTLFQCVTKKIKPQPPYHTLSLTNPKLKGFIEFLSYAKTIEKSSTIMGDPWDYNQSTTRNFVPIAILNAVEKRYNETSDPFLKNRFWFQTMKSYFYSANQKDIIAFFEKTKSAQPKNALYYRGVAYVGGVHYRAKNYSTANYLYSIVFDNLPALRQVAAFNFHPQEDADFIASLSLTADKKEKAALWAVYGFYRDELKAMQEIYSIDPANPHLSYLLTRAINKQERVLSYQPSTTTKDYKRILRENANAELLKFVEQVANKANTAQPDLWLASAGYLNTFAGKYQQAASLFDKAEAKATATSEVGSQVRLLRMINTISSLDKIDTRSEQKLLSEMKWIHSSCSDTGESFRCSNVLGWSNWYMSSLYEQANNRLMAELFRHTDTYYRNETDLEQMKSFLQKSVYTDWEKMILDRYAITLSDIFEYQAVMSAFTGNLGQALTHMEKSEGKSTVLPGNPFNGKIKDCHDCDHAAPQKVKYTKLSFLQTMKQMQQNVNANNDVYNNSLLLANAYYNMTYHGNARVFYEGDVMNQYGNNIDPFYYPQLLNCDRAKKYYQQALAAASTDEQRTKCVYMIAKCERNEYYNTTIYAGTGTFDGEFVAWESFKTLKENYSATRYYQDVIKECGYFRTYVENN